jgi:hypothetical protein
MKVVRMQPKTSQTGSVFDIKRKGKNGQYYTDSTPAGVLV